jgi:peptide/nickel transport system permease protein
VSVSNLDAAAGASTVDLGDDHDRDGGVDPGALPESYLLGLARRFARDRTALVALVFLIVVAVLAISAPWIAPYDPRAIDTSRAFLLPSPEHWLGTDDIGRDLFSRMLYGARLSLGAATISVGLGALIGVVPGLVAGYRGGYFDTVVSRVVDAVMCIPGLILSISLVAVLGPGIYQVAIAVGIAFGPRFYRVARGAALSVSSETYVKAARSVGSKGPRILVRHVVPNALPPIVVQASLMFGFGVLAEAGLSFLGMGAQPPAASWGSMLQRGTQFMTQSQYLTFMPGVVIVLTVLAANTVGDGLQSVLGVQRVRTREARA